MSDFNVFLPIAKVEKQKDGSCLVHGYASTPALDTDGEIVSLEAVKAALPGYMQWRNIREMHRPSAVGVAKEANIDSRGLFVTSRITDKSAVEKCLDNVYKGYSIGGKKLAKSGNTITEIDLIEISLVDRPANPECSISVAKRAKVQGEAPGYLLKSPSGKAGTKLAKAIASQVSEFLDKAGPPAARDGFSLPVGKMCKAHSMAACPDCMCKKHSVVDCEKCAMKLAKRLWLPRNRTTWAPKQIAKFQTAWVDLCKREFSESARRAAASSGAAMPDGSYPIENVSDLHNAIQAIGRAKDPEAAKRHIRRRAKALGATDALPDTWSKSARKAARIAARTALRKLAEDEFPLLVEGSAEPPFLTLKADTGLREAGGGVAPTGDAVLAARKGGTEIGLSKVERKALRAQLDSEFFQEEPVMTKTNGSEALDAFLANLAKAQRTPTRMQHMMAAKVNMKKARKARGVARDLIAGLHKSVRDAYVMKMEKAAKKPGGEQTNDKEFNYQDAMEKLQKAASNLDMAKTFDQAAKGHFAKAMSGPARSGQRGQEAGDAQAGFYQVPAGVKDLSPEEMATLSPGSTDNGSFPPVLDMETVFPGKMAKKGQHPAIDLSRYVPKSEAELMAKNAKLEAEVELLSKQPVGSNRPVPYSFNVAKTFGAANTQADANPWSDPELRKGVNTAMIQPGFEHNNESGHREALGAIIGRGILSGKAARNVWDADFHGGVIAGSASN